jgi:hypothetical protein
MADAPRRDEDAAEQRLNRLLNMILESAVAALGFDAATVSARHIGNYATVAATNQRFIALDDAQYATGQGPCLEALDGVESVTVADASTDDRWTHFSNTAAHLGSTRRCRYTCRWTPRTWQGR